MAHPENPNSDTFNAQVTPEQTICKWRWSYPVVHISRGELRTCDKPINIPIREEDLVRLGTDAFLNNEYLTERRREKLLGKRHSDCFTCIKLEDRGIQSTRTGKDRFVTYMNDVVGVPGQWEDFRGRTDEQLVRADHPDLLEISLSNLCNFKCIYCSPHFSTAWEAEAIRFGDMTPEATERRARLASPLFEPKFWEWFEKIKNSLDRVIFIGGEPTINDKFLPFLERIEHSMRDSRQAREGRRLTINIISNFNAPRARFRELVALLPKLAELFIVHIEASGESVGSRAEYIRSGMDWDLYVENVRDVLSLRNPYIRFGFQMAVNALCITSLKQLLVMADDLQGELGVPVDYKENIVVAPESLAPYTLTPDFAAHLEDCHRFVTERLANPSHNRLRFLYDEPSAERWKKYLPFLESLRRGIASAEPNRGLRVGFRKFLERNDARRGSQFLEIFPEYETFWKLCAE